MAPRGSQQKQIGVALADAVRARVEAAANKAGHSIAEEIRQRLERTFVDDDVDPETQRMMNAIRFLAVLIKIQTGQNWYSNPAATSVMRHAIDALLVRLKGGDGEAEFLPDELPPKETRWLPLPDDPRGMGVALAAAAGLGDRLGMVNLPPIRADMGKKPSTTEGEEQ